MTFLPNWVDLIIVTLVFIKSYRGFYGGLLTELLQLIGLVSVTVLAVNYSNVALQWLSVWLVFGPVASLLIVFWLIFLVGCFLVYRVISLISKVIKWERLHWTTQLLGLITGALQGLWWAGLVVMILKTSGFVYLQESVEQRAVLGSRLLPVVQETLQRMSDRFPGAKDRVPSLVPPLKANH